MIPPAAEWPKHRNSKLGSTMSQWHGSDAEKSFVKHWHNLHTRQKLNDFGWTENSITYAFNEQGFRSIAFEPGLSAGMALGCSYTQGEGLAVDQVWPSIVSQRINLPVYNLGVGGCSMDTMFRLAEYWVPVLKPKFLLIASTFSHRVELGLEDNKFVNLSPSVDSWKWQVSDQHQKTLCENFYRSWILNIQNSKINFKKNLLAITAICNQHGIPVVEINTQYHMGHDQAARDLMHPGPVKQAEFAEKMLEKMKGII